MPNLTPLQLLAAFLLTMSLLAASTFALVKGIPVLAVCATAVLTIFVLYLLGLL